MKILIVRFRKIKLFFNAVVENVSRYVTVGKVDDDYDQIDVMGAMTEMDFYTAFINIKIALSKSAYKNHHASDLSAVNVMYLATIMCKPLDFVMPAMSKNNVQTELARELGRTSKSIYSAVTRLRKAGFLVTTEDNLIEPHPELQTLRKMTKRHLEATGTFPISYVLNFIVSETGSGSTSEESN